MANASSTCNVGIPGEGGLQKPLNEDETLPLSLPGDMGWTGVTPVRPVRARTRSAGRANAHRGPQGSSGGGTKVKTYLRTRKFSSTGALPAMAQGADPDHLHVKNMGLARRARGFRVPTYIHYDRSTPLA